MVPLQFNVKKLIQEINGRGWFFLIHEMKNMEYKWSSTWNIKDNEAIHVLLRESNAVTSEKKHKANPSCEKREMW